MGQNWTLGRSRGGLTTKIHMLADGLGRPLRFILTPGQTGTIVLVEGLTLTAVSGFIGVSLGLLATWYFFGDGLDMSVLLDEEMTFSGVVIDPVMVPQFYPVRVGQILAFILAIGAVASVYPALRAARIDIAESMKFER